MTVRRSNKHPMQPIDFDTDGIIRFQKNKIISFLIEWSSSRGIDMNALAVMDFSNEDRMQFAQLIGYSVSGYGELPYASKQSVLDADTKADELVKKRKRRKA